MKTIKIGLLPRILIAIALGIMLGTVTPDMPVRLFVTFNSLFSEFLSFLIPLIIVGLVTPAIADIGKGAGRLLVVTGLMAYGATVLAGLLSYGVSQTTFPSLISSDLQLDMTRKAVEAKPFFTITMKPLMEVMTSLVLAFTLGLGIAHLDSTSLKNGFAEFRTIITRTIQVVVLPLLPIYIFGIFFSMTHTGEVFRVLSVFIKIIGVIFVVHIVWLLLLYGVAGLVVRRNPLRLLYRMLPAYFTALGTQSSAATIPVTLRQTEANGVRSEVAGFVVPLCATIHLSGSMLKIVACAMALMMMQHMGYDFLSMLGFILMLGVTMVAAPGVPGGAIMAALGVLSSMLDFGQQSLALMIALYIAMDSFGTACNVTGDGALALIIDRWHRPRESETHVA